MINHVDNYLKWLKENMKQTVISSNLVELTTPFLDRHNDYTQIYLEEQSDQSYVISDRGYTVTDLKLSGVDMTTDKRSAIFQQILNRLGIQFDVQSDVLYLKCSRNRIPEAQHTLLQGMLDINDMFYLNTETVVNLFYSDVKEFFQANSIYFSEDMEIRGRSGLSHSFPFFIQNNKTHPDRFVRLSNRFTRSEAERFMFAWEDVAQIRNAKGKSSSLIILINDTKKINEELLANVIQYDSNIIPLPWSTRETKLKLFA